MGRAMKRYLTCIHILFSILVLSSCGKSPLLNHDLAKPKGPSEPGAPTISNTECPWFFKTENLCFNLTWTVGPSLQQDNSFVLKFWDKTTGKPDIGPFKLPAKRLEILPWMSMGHGSFHDVVIQQLEIPAIRASEVRFIMPGQWDIHFKLFDGGALVDEVLVPIKL